MTLTEFLLARIAEDEAGAKAASPGPWKVDDPTYPEAIYAADGYETVVAGGRWGGEARIFNEDADAHFIARHDPARVLAECESKRDIIGFLLAAESGIEQLRPDDRAMRALALPYADHPDYRPEWRVTA